MSPPPPPASLSLIPQPLLPLNNATQLPPPVVHHRHHHRLIAPLTAATASFSVFLFFILLCHRLFRRRTPPSCDLPTESLRRFSYSSLRCATSSFSSSRRLGQGGFGAVYSGNLSDKKLQRKLDVAVKVMDSGSLQGEREFHNEILMASKLADSDHVVHLLGFASDRRRRRMCLVYDLMVNGNLQERLLHRKCQELMSWSRRRQIVVEVAKGLAYLHHQCDPPIIHGDVKPSNVLLDKNFSAKIGDFGLARLKLVDQCEISINCDEGELASLKNGNKEELRINVVEDSGSIVETESVITLGLEEASTCLDQSPENFARVQAVETSPEMFSAVASPSEVVEIVEEPRPAKVKDYVIEWIGSEIDKERSNNNWIGAASTSSAAVPKPEQKKKSKNNKHRLDWWMAMDDDISSKKGRRKPVREWWKEEYSEELAKKNKKKRKKKINQQQGEVSDDHNDEDNWWPRDDELLYVDRKVKSKRRKNSRGNLEWWLDGLSGELWKTRHTSCDSMSGEIPKSGGVSSTPSMRGTVCYIAPEYSGGGDLSEKCDVYSFGVLLLVVIAGRRPLQVSGSPVTEYKSANLLSWARKLARMGKLLDLVDKKVDSLNKEEAEVCIKVALLCLQKSPARRPSMKDIVGMLTGELDLPCLPPELSPSRPSRFPCKKGPVRS